MFVLSIILLLLALISCDGISKEMIRGSGMYVLKKRECVKRGVSVHLSKFFPKFLVNSFVSKETTELINNDANNNMETKVNHSSDSFNGALVQSSFTNQSEHELKVKTLMSKYGGKFACVKIPQIPSCEIYLCGTLHVSSSSTTMVEEVIQKICPNVVMVELCGNRVDSLIAQDELEAGPIFLKDVFRAAWIDKSVMTLGTGLLVWMQGKAANLLGNKLGGELVAAAKMARKVGAIVVLGDRLYDVTIQRIFDRLSFAEKVKAGFLMMWEVITMSMSKMKEYVAKSHENEDFVSDEIEKFGKYFPSLADVIIHERDEYLAQSIREAAYYVASSRPNEYLVSPPIKKCLVAVVGAGHMNGIRHHLEGNGIPLSRLLEISKSSRHESTWPKAGYFPTVNLDAIYGNANSS